ncbi:MAG: isopentenyl phosphate kinase [Candidatus Promineifilaceae bacterium]|nr:isopentenyl phosphate kinase [Candidatus Promineifilaceae bacterium]
MSTLLFLKLGGSLITDKRGEEALRPAVLGRLAGEIRAALDEARNGEGDFRLVVGHGSGSFGHVAAAEYDTRAGVRSAEAWRGFARVSDAAARLNRLVCQALLAAGVPAVSLQPSASALCRDGGIVEMAVRPVKMALDAGLVPLVYGDVAFDTVRGGTIISTEEVLGYLAQEMAPAWFLLAGETAGVYDEAGDVIAHITEENFGAFQEAVGRSRGTDVTGGMATKVRAMLDLAAAHPDLSIRIFSGMEAGRLRQALLRPEVGEGTVIG